jgi:hypothetical protein
MSNRKKAQSDKSRPVKRAEKRVTERATAKKETEQRNAEKRSRPGLTRAEAEALVRAHGIAGPVRFEQSLAPVEKITADDIRALGKSNTLWLCKHRDANGKVRKNVKVQRYDDGRWTCSCEEWKNRRTRDCGDIIAVKKMLGIATVPYATARRAGPTFYFFPEDEYSEDTRKRKAREAMPWRLPQLIEHGCEFLIEEPPHDHVGKTGVPFKVLAYALITKVVFNLSYPNLCARLQGDEAIWRLGYTSPDPLTEQTLCRRFGQGGLTPQGFVRPELAPLIFKMIGPTAFPGNRVDSIITGDSHDLPTVYVQNGRDNKYGPPSASYRSRKPMVRQHFAVGAISGLIYAVNVTMSQGPGAGDNAHLPALTLLTHEVAPDAKDWAWDRAYSGYRNYAAVEAVGGRLYIPEKANEDRLNGKWGPMAEEMAILEREQPDEFDRVYKKRSKGEHIPMVIQRMAPRIRLQRRTGDTDVQFPEGVDDDKLSNLPEDVISKVLEAAEQSVGRARLAEAYATIVGRNLMRLVYLEQLHRDIVNFEIKRDFNPIPIVRDVDLGHYPKAA